LSVRILKGDCREVLATLPDESVHCVVTSPPYFGLRDYGGAGQIGLETSPEEFVSELVDVFREVKRILRSDGSLWLNLGDSYANDGKWGGHTGGKHVKALHGSPIGRNKRYTGLKPKDLIGIPWMTAFALRADGWWLRGDNIWAKANGMPDSTKDRPGRAHEIVFQFSKSQDYYFGYEDVKLPPVPESVGRLARAMRSKMDAGLVMSGGDYSPPGQPPHQSARQSARQSDKQRGHSRRHAGFNDRWDAMEKAKQQADGAGLRSVWWIAPGGYEEAHFAVMAEEVAATCVIAGCPVGGTVLDPFGGAGTTALVADRLKRNAILIELNPEYADIAQRRIQGDGGMFASVVHG
jgi:DNA modification methylase